MTLFVLVALSLGCGWGRPTTESGDSLPADSLGESVPEDTDCCDCHSPAEAFLVANLAWCEWIFQGEEPCGGPFASREACEEEVRALAAEADEI